MNDYMYDQTRRKSDSNQSETASGICQVNILPNYYVLNWYTALLCSYKCTVYHCITVVTLLGYYMGAIIFGTL